MTTARIYLTKKEWEVFAEVCRYYGLAIGAQGEFALLHYIKNGIVEHGPKTGKTYGAVAIGHDVAGKFKEFVKESYGNIDYNHKLAIEQHIERIKETYPDARKDLSSTGGSKKLKKP